MIVGRRQSENPPVVDVGHQAAASLAVNVEVDASRSQVNPVTGSRTTAPLTTNTLPRASPGRAHRVHSRSTPLLLLPCDEELAGEDEEAALEEDAVPALEAGAAALDEGATLDDEADALDDGAATLDDGAATVDDGAATLDDGAATLDEATARLEDGAATPDDGATTEEDDATVPDDDVAARDDGAADEPEEGAGPLEFRPLSTDALLRPAEDEGAPGDDVALEVAVTPEEENDDVKGAARQ